MNYLTFRDKLYPSGCFNINQVLLWESDFDRNNLTRWCKQGLLTKLRNEHYAFPDFLQKPDSWQYVANSIYSPSYISLHTALSFYGIIPEEVTSVTSITTLKPATFRTPFCTFVYQSVKTALFFGFETKLLQNRRAVRIATPEKALLDLLYLNSFYKSENDMLELRLDEDFLQTELDLDRMEEFLAQFKNKSLEKRVHVLRKTYDI